MLHLEAEIATQLRKSALTKASGRAAQAVTALMMLDDAFGKEWMVRSGIVKRTMSALTVDIEFFRVLRLADALYNMREVRGFDKKLLKARSSFDVAELEAEFWPARLVLSAGVELEFIDAARVPGKSPDARLAHGVAHAEFKNKIPSTPFKYETILRSLRAAARKPAPGPKVLYLRLPTEWQNELVELNVMTAFADVARQNASVALQIAHFELDDPVWSAVGTYSHRNHTCRFRSDELEALVERLAAQMQAIPPGWVTVEALCEAASLRVHSAIP